MKNKCYHSLILLPILTLLFSCGGPTSTSPSSRPGEIIGENSNEFHPGFESTPEPSPSAPTESVTPSVPSLLAPILGVYEGEDMNSSVLTFEVKESGEATLKREDPALEVVFTFSKKDGDYYHFTSKDQAHTLVAYSFIYQHRISLDLDEGSYVEEYGLFMENCEFIAK